MDVWARRARPCRQAVQAISTTQMAANKVNPTTARAPDSRPASNRVFRFVRITSPPTATPMMRAGIRETSQAAIGAAASPPTSSAATTPRSIPNSPRLTTKPRLAASETRNSLVSTEPMTVRGAVLPALSSVVVATGPQPPPPVASTKPPASPSGTKNREPCGERRACATAGGRKAYRSRI